LSWTLSHPLSTSLKPPCSPRVTSWSRSARRSPTRASLNNCKERQKAYRLRRQSECPHRWCGTHDRGQPKLNMSGSVCLRIVVILTMRCAIATAISLARYQDRLGHVGQSSNLAIAQAHIQMLPLAGLPSLNDGSQDTVDCVQTGRKICHRNANLDWRSISGPCDVHQAHFPTREKPSRQPLMSSVFCVQTYASTMTSYPARSLYGPVWP
jgi:hypothetical protein